MVLKTFDVGLRKDVKIQTDFLVISKIMSELQSFNVLIYALVSLPLLPPLQFNLPANPMLVTIWVLLCVLTPLIIVLMGWVNVTIVVKLTVVDVMAVPPLATPPSPPFLAVCQTVLILPGLPVSLLPVALPLVRVTVTNTVTVPSLVSHQLSIV